MKRVRYPIPLAHHYPLSSKTDPSTPLPYIAGNGLGIHSSTRGVTTFLSLLSCFLIGLSLGGLENESAKYLSRVPIPLTMS